jgi:hypothetical protein
MSDTPSLDKFRKNMSGRVKPLNKEVMQERYNIESRSKERVPREGSQRRCYNGCFPDSDWKIVWGPWEIHERNMPESRLVFWRELNDYAVSQRGSADASEYRIVNKCKEQ